MGWTFTHKEKGSSIKSFFEQEMNYNDKDGYYGKVLDCKSKLKTAYIAYEVGNPTGPSRVVGIVCLLHYTKNYDRINFNFGYKDIDECMGPWEDNCPKGILDLLTPTNSQSANEWRNRCNEALKRREVVSSIKIGDKIKFDNEFSFKRYGKTNVFEAVNVQKGHYFAYQLGYTVKLTKNNLNNNPWVKI